MSPKTVDSSFLPTIWASGRSLERGGDGDDVASNSGLLGRTMVRGSGVVEVVDGFRLPCLEDEVVGLGFLDEADCWDAMGMVSVKRRKNKG